MPPKKEKSTTEETMEEVVKRVTREAWRDEELLRKLANLVRDSVVAELQSTIDRNTAVIENLQVALAERDNTIKQLEAKLDKKTDELEQYQRRQCLRIFGVKEEEGENTDDIVLDVAKKVGVDITIADIDRSHRVGRKGGEKPRPVIVKFVSYRKRSELFRNKRRLKSTNLTLREDLTKSRHILLTKCIEKYGLHNVWTTDGNIIAKVNNTKHRITCAEEMV